MRTVVLHRSPCVVRIGLPYGIVADFHNVFILRQPLIGQFLRKLLSYLFSCSDRQFQLYGDTGIILCREELRTNPLCTQQADNEESDTSRNDYRTMANRPIQHLAIPSVESVQRFFNRSEEELEQL